MSLIRCGLFDYQYHSSPKNYISKDVFKDIYFKTYAEVDSSQDFAFIM